MLYKERFGYDLGGVVVLEVSVCIKCFFSIGKRVIV